MADVGAAGATGGATGGAEGAVRGAELVRGPLELLRAHTMFRRVWVGAFASNIGGWMEVVGVQWAMAQATLDPRWLAEGRPSAPVMMGVLAAAQLLPQVVLGLVGGVAADRVNRRTLILVTQSARMVIAAVLCVLAWMGGIDPVALLVLGALDGIALAFNLPAWQVLAPRLVSRRDLPTAMALNGMQFNLARAVGPALAGVVLGLDQGLMPALALVFLINAVSYVGILWALATTPDDPRPKRAPGEAVPRTIAQIAEGFAFVRSHRGVLCLVLGLTVFSMLATPLLRFLPILVKEVYVPGATEGVQERAFGMLLGVMGLGAVLGALTLKRIPVWYPRHHVVPLSMSLCALSMALLAASTTLAMAGMAMVLVGFFWLWSFNQSYAALQLLLDDRVRGRVMAISNMGALGATPLGALIGAGLGTALAGRESEGPAAVLAVGALALTLLVASSIMLAYRTPEVDGITPGMPGYDRAPGLFRGITARAHRRRG